MVNTLCKKENPYLLLVDCTGLAGLDTEAKKPVHSCWILQLDTGYYTVTGYYSFHSQVLKMGDEVGHSLGSNLQSH